MGGIPLPGPLWGLDLSRPGRAVIRADRTALELALQEGLSLSEFLSVVSNEALRARGLDCKSFDAELIARLTRHQRPHRFLTWLQTWGGDTVGAASLFVILFVLLFFGGLYQ